MCIRRGLRSARDIEVKRRRGGWWLVTYDVRGSGDDAMRLGFVVKCEGVEKKKGKREKRRDEETRRDERRQVRDPPRSF